jgi:wyosine [tRNA(Phe)-imidazoG37] synthetase (radical SAM superfamily)
MLISSKEGQVNNVEGGSLRKLLDAVLDVKPDLVQLEVPYRPPSESFVHKPSRERIEQISREFAEALGEDRLWFYGRHDRRGKRVKWLKHISFEREALDLLKRRPCRIVDVSLSLGISSSAAKSLLKDWRKGI